MYDIETLHVVAASAERHRIAANAAYDTYSIAFRAEYARQDGGRDSELDKIEIPAEAVLDNARRVTWIAQFAERAAEYSVASYT